MPYKSKRTRDLQGEVVAGTGITITEQTKPDGTKEYTITNGDPASAITVDGTGLSLISNVLRNTMAAIMGWSGDYERGAINWTDDNGDTVLKIIPLEALFIGDAHDNNDFIIKHINGENRLIRGTLQIAENINSTGGVSLNTLVNNVQTLADMSNSLAMWKMAELSIFGDNNIYYCIFEENGIQEKQIEEIGEFYEFAKSNIICCTIGTDTYYLYGVKFLKPGIYLITCNFPISAIAIAYPVFYIKKETESGTETQIYDSVFTMQAGDDTLITVTTYINVNENDIICPYMAGNEYFSFSSAITLSMQKIR